MPDTLKLPLRCTNLALVLSTLRVGRAINLKQSQFSYTANSLAKPEDARRGCAPTVIVPQLNGYAMFTGGITMWKSWLEKVMLTEFSQY